MHATCHMLVWATTEDHWAPAWKLAKPVAAAVHRWKHQLRTAVVASCHPCCMTHIDDRGFKILKIYGREEAKMYPTHPQIHLFVW